MSKQASRYYCPRCAVYNLTARETKVVRRYDRERDEEITRRIHRRCGSIVLNEDDVTISV